MKLSFGQIEAFVAKPAPAARVILIFGPDIGLVRERAKIIGRQVVADLNDPFNAVTLSGDMLAADPARLYDETSAMSMMGGDRLIRIEEGEDKLKPLIEDYLKSPSAQNLVLIEAGALSAKSALRLLCEKSKAAAAIPCYVDEGRDLSALIRDSFRKEGYSVDTDALSWLADNIGGDRLRVRGEIEKIILYQGPDQRSVRLEDVIAVCGEAGAQDMDNLVMAVFGNRPESCLKCYAQLMAEGVNAVAILRVMQNHLRRLHVTLARIDAGMPMEEALKSLSPQVFYKQMDDFKAQLRRWSMPQLELLLQRLSGLEAQAKQTGTPVETLCAQAFLSISAARR